jgi:DNA-binding MarR family transcriptional regulator
MAAATRTIDLAELAGELRPALLRLTRKVRQQRVDRSVTLTELSALGALYKNQAPMTAGELAAAEQVQPPSMTKVLAGLEERGLARREPSPTDKRQALISITDAGLDLLAEERQARDAWLSRRLETLTDEERDILHQAAPILAKLAEQP